MDLCGVAIVIIIIMMMMMMMIMMMMMMIMMMEFLALKVTINLDPCCSCLLKCDVLMSFTARPRGQI